MTIRFPPWLKLLVFRILRRLPHEYHMEGSRPKPKVLIK